MKTASHSGALALDATPERLPGDADRYRLLVDAIDDHAVVMLDPTGHVVSWNRGAERVKGYAAAEMIGQHFSRCYPAADNAAGKPARELRIAAIDGRFENEGWRVRRDGSRMWAHAVTSPLRDPAGMLLGFARVTRDISETRRAHGDLEGFTYGVSHDLRAPIRHIESLAASLMEAFGATLDEGARVYIRRIQKDARRLDQLVTDLATLSQVGRQGLRIQSCAPGPIVAGIAAALMADLASREVELVLGHLPMLRCDANLARIVFSNLLSNALKFTRGRAHAVVEVGAMSSRGQPVLYVRDNGIGFDPKYADRLFGVFQRLHPEFEGSGVGLATVQRIIHKHGGDVWVDAAPDHGATFYFTFGSSPHPVTAIGQ